MGMEKDDEKDVSTYDDIVGKSIRRGKSKAFNDLSFGNSGGGEPSTDPSGNLVEDAVKDLPAEKKHSRRKTD